MFAVPKPASRLYGTFQVYDVSALEVVACDFTFGVLLTSAHSGKWTSAMPAGQQIQKTTLVFAFHPALFGCAAIFGMPSHFLPELHI